MSYNFKQVDYRDLAPLVMDNKNIITIQTKTLWTNQSYPTETWSGRTITVEDFSKYNYLLIFYRNWTYSEYKGITANSCLIETMVDNYANLGTTETNGNICTRRVSLQSNTTIQFGNGYLNSNTNNSAIVPIKIVGIKLVNLAKITNKYSDEEVVVGEWVDGKPVYRKTFTLNNHAVINSNWTNILENTLNIKQVINSFAISGDIEAYSVSPLIRIHDGYIQGFYPETVSLKILTIEYTKITDEV